MMARNLTNREAASGPGAQPTASPQATALQTWGGRGARGARQGEQLELVVALLAAELVKVR